MPGLCLDCGKFYRVDTLLTKYLALAGIENKGCDC